MQSLSIIIRKGFICYQIQPYLVQSIISTPLKYSATQKPLLFNAALFGNQVKWSSEQKSANLQWLPTGPDFSLGALTFPRVHVGALQTTSTLKPVVLYTLQVTIHVAYHYWQMHSFKVLKIYSVTSRTQGHLDLQYTLTIVEISDFFTLTWKL